MVFGCRQVCIPLKKPAPASSKLRNQQDVSLPFLRAPRGAQADQADAGCSPTLWQPSLPLFSTGTPGWLAQLGPHLHRSVPSTSLAPNTAGLTSQTVACIPSCSGPWASAKVASGVPAVSRPETLEGERCASGGPSVWCGERWRQTTVTPKSTFQAGARNKKDSTVQCFHP